MGASGFASSLPFGAGEACRLYCSVSGPLQTVQRAEIWGVLVALQGCVNMHIGVDNLNVVNHVAGIISGRRTGRPLSLGNDGDLLLKVQQMVEWRGFGIAAVTKVKGHADEGLVAQGRVREVDRIGNNEADAAADLGGSGLTMLLLMLVGFFGRACVRWYPVVQKLHRCFIAIARTALNEDGVAGTAIHPVVWSAAANPKRRKVERAVGNFAWLPGPANLWTSDWSQVPVARIDGADVAVWPFSVGPLVKFANFLGSLHWPCGAGDLGVGGVSYFEPLILYEKWAGERLVVDGAIPAGKREGRPISVLAVPLGPGIDIWRSCRFIGSLFRFLGNLPGGMARFVPCHVGAHHCRLRHLGWEKCGHGLTSRPRETSETAFLDSLREIFGYPARSGPLLLAGELPLRYYSGNFALRKPSWSLPEVGGVQALLTIVLADFSLGNYDAGSGHLMAGGCWTKGAGGFWKRVRLTKKTASSLVRRHGDLRVLHGRRWKRLHAFEGFFGEDGSCKRRRLSVHVSGSFPREGIG